MPSRRRFLLASLAVLGASSSPALSAPDEAAAKVQAFYDALQKMLSGAEAGDAKARNAALFEAMSQSFDLGEMTRLAVGSRWRTIPADKQAKLQDAFGRYFVASYGNGFGRASGGKFEVEPASDQRTGGRVVHTRVVDPSGRATKVDYLVNPAGKIVDVYFNGTVSELAAYRTDFDKILAQGGPDALEANLRQRAEPAAK